MRYERPQEEYLYPGHIGCPGCGASLSMRYALQVLGKKTMVVIPACCWSTIGGFFPSTSLKVPILHTAFETAAVTAAGVKKGLAARGIEDVQIMAWAGDGGTFDIGLQSLSGSAERNDDIIYVCYDNEAYMNTGIQRSSATPFLSWTTTTPNPAFKETPKKDIMEIMAAHRIPYAATASPAFPGGFSEQDGQDQSKPKASASSIFSLPARRDGNFPRSFPSRFPGWPWIRKFFPSSKSRTGENTG